MKRADCKALVNPVRSFAANIPSILGNDPAGLHGDDIALDHPTSKGLWLGYYLEDIDGKHCFVDQAFGGGLIGI